MAALGGRELQRRIKPRGQGVNGGEAGRERHAAAAALGLGEGRQPTPGEAALHRAGAAGAVNVAAFKRYPLVGAQARLGGKDHHRAKQRPQLDGQRVHLRARKRVQLLRARLWVAPGGHGGIRGDVAPALGGG